MRHADPTRLALNGSSCSHPNPTEGTVEREREWSWPRRAPSALPCPALPRLKTSPLNSLAPVTTPPAATSHHSPSPAIARIKKERFASVHRPARSAGAEERERERRRTEPQPPASVTAAAETERIERKGSVSKKGNQVEAEGEWREAWLDPRFLPIPQRSSRVGRRLRFHPHRRV